MAPEACLISLHFTVKHCLYIELNISLLNVPSFRLAQAYLNCEPTQPLLDSIDYDWTRNFLSERIHVATSIAKGDNL